MNTVNMGYTEYIARFKFIFKCPFWAEVPDMYIYFIRGSVGKKNDNNSPGGNDSKLTLQRKLYL